uniref:Apyrase-1 isoform 3 n=1 Tax=Heligmosomoides polygyrus bakeri TaxID=375939 RepID=G4WZX6_HELBE|nr:apyrase-1 isoform 3 [Heligmosomoides bakeri]
MWCLSFLLAAILCLAEIPQEARAGPLPVGECTVDASDRTLNIIAITDMDKESRTSPEGYTWRALTRKGQLFVKDELAKLEVTWDLSSDQNLTTHLNMKGRAMEMSDLVKFNGHLLSPDDKTGMIFEIEEKKAIPWLFLNSGPGDTTSGMKAEWMTLKDDQLYVGGHGMRYRNKKGEVFSTDAMWIKIVSHDGVVKSVDWTDVYDKIAQAAGATSPGYLTHEAVQWSAIHKRWFFLPRKYSTEIYNDELDELRGTNLLITADESMEDIQVAKIGELTHPDRGYSAFDFVPGTCDSVILALKSKEHGGSTESYITALDTDGKVLLEDQRLDGDLKFEGLYFL